MKKSSDIVCRIREAIKQADPGLNENDESYKAAAVLLAAIQIGTNQTEIAKRLKYPQSLVSKFACNLKKNGVWKGNKIYAEWEDPENGGTSFWLDVCVAQGLMKRV